MSHRWLILEGASKVRSRADGTLAASLMPKPFDQWLGVELRHLATFHAVAEEESFSRAAAKLGYTQSAVSHQIADLERIVGVRLIDRPGGPRRVSLTEHGTLLLRHAHRMLAALSAAEADMRRLRDGERTVSVGTFQSFGAKVLPSIIKLFASDFPETAIQLTEQVYDGDLLRSVEAGDLEVAFATLPLEDGPFDLVELLADPYVLLVPAESELATRDSPVNLRELAQIPLISFQRCRKIAQLEEGMRRRGLNPVRLPLRRQRHYASDGVGRHGRSAATAARDRAGLPGDLRCRARSCGFSARHRRRLASGSGLERHGEAFRRDLAPSLRGAGTRPLARDPGGRSSVIRVSWDGFWGRARRRRGRRGRRRGR